MIIACIYAVLSQNFFKIFQWNLPQHLIFNLTLSFSLLTIITVIINIIIIIVSWWQNAGPSRFCLVDQWQWVILASH